MRELVAAVAGPRQVSDSRESWLRRAARKAGVSFRQAKALFYGEITDPQSKVVAKFRAAAGRHDAAELADRFERLAEALNFREAEDGHRDEVAALVAAARALRHLAGAGVGEDESVEDQGG